MVFVITDTLPPFASVFIQLSQHQIPEKIYGLYITAILPSRLTDQQLGLSINHGFWIAKSGVNFDLFLLSMRVNFDSIGTQTHRMEYYPRQSNFLHFCQVLQNDGGSQEPDFDFVAYNLKMLYQTKHTEAMIFGEQDSLNLSSPKNSLALHEFPQKLNRNGKSRRESYWSVKEQRIYLNFLNEHMPMINFPQYRKKQRIFKKISVLLGTRTPIQVKSHHQKLEDRHKSIPKIISYLEKQANASYQEESHADLQTITLSVQIQQKDACIQTETPICHALFFEAKMLEDYIYSEFNLDEDSLFA